MDDYFVNSSNAVAAAMVVMVMGGGGVRCFFCWQSCLGENSGEAKLE